MCLLLCAGNSSKGKAGGHSTYNPQSLLSAVCCHAPVFKGKQQHDAHELMRMLLDGLQVRGWLGPVKQHCSGFFVQGFSICIELSSSLASSQIISSQPTIHQQPASQI